MWLLLIYVLLCCLAAVKVGAKRRIGEGWTFFFCFFFTLPIGLLIAAYSPMLSSGEDYKMSKINKAILSSLFVLSSILIMYFAFSKRGEVQEQQYRQVVLFCLMLSVGLVGAAFYVIRIRSLTPAKQFAKKIWIWLSEDISNK